MSKAPSAETQLRAVKRDLVAKSRIIVALKETSEHYRARATKAEQEVAEWKTRFDALLAKTPKED